MTKDEAIDYKTNLPGIYATGDVIGPPWLAHVAMEEATLCVERIAWRKDKSKLAGGHEPIPINYTVVPGCTYCIPQVASVGFTEQKLIADGLVKGKDYEVGKYGFTAHGKAIAAAHTDGFVKIIRGLPRGEILGAHIIGDPGDGADRRDDPGAPAGSDDGRDHLHDARAPDDARGRARGRRWRARDG